MPIIIHQLQPTKSDPEPWAVRRVLVPASLHIMSTTNWVSHTPETRRAQDQISPENDSFYNTVDDIPPSPLNAFEKFFLPGLTNINQFAAVARAGRNPGNSSAHRRSITDSIRTDDFASAAEELSEADSDTDSDIDPDQLSIEKALYSDIFGLSAPLVEADDDSLISEEDHPPNDDEMASKNRRSKKNKPSSTTESKLKTPSLNQVPSDKPTSIMESTTTPTPELPESETPHFHVVDHVYEGAKTVWTATKSFPVFTPFMGIAEGVTVKVLSMSTGIDSLKTVDENIKPHVTGIDSDLLDPAIAKVVSLVEAIIGKGDEVLKSIVGLVHKPHMPAIMEGEEEEETVPEGKKSPEVVSPETSKPAAAGLAEA